MGCGQGGQHSQFVERPNKRLNLRSENTEHYTSFAITANIKLLLMIYIKQYLLLVDEEPAIKPIPLRTQGCPLNISPRQCPKSTFRLQAQCQKSMT